MDNIKIVKTNVTLSFTKLPYRKQHCVIIGDDKSAVILGYTRESDLSKATELWLKMLEGN